MHKPPIYTPDKGPRERARAKFTLRVVYNRSYQLANRKPGQTFRDDITFLQYINRGIHVEGLHPLALLTKLYKEIKHNCYAVWFYDNDIEGTPQDQTICKIIIDKGSEEFYGDRREDYYDLKTGKPLNVTTNESES